MFCLRSWLPLLFIPTNASPLFIVSFVTLTYILHRPCIYCSALLLILFMTSCNWSDRCFFDLRGDWFSPRFTPSFETYSSSLSVNSTLAPCGVENAVNSSIYNESFTGYVFSAANSTAKALAGAAVGEVQRHLAVNGSSAFSGTSQQAWTGIGLGWLRSLLGRREWTLPCVDVKVRL